MRVCSPAPSKNQMIFLAGFAERTNHSPRFSFIRPLTENRRQKRKALIRSKMFAAGSPSSPGEPVEQELMSTFPPHGLSTCGRGYEPRPGAEGRGAGFENLREAPAGAQRQGRQELGPRGPLGGLSWKPVRREEVAGLWPGASLGEGAGDRDQTGKLILCLRWLRTRHCTKCTTQVTFIP